MYVKAGFAALALVASGVSAHAHGIAGNRYFAGTLTFDDPAVADEAIVPNFAVVNYPAAGNTSLDSRLNWSFDRLLTPTLAVTYDSGWIHQNWPTGRASGFDATDAGLKYEAYRNNQHEALVSVALAWGIGRSGAQSVGADKPNTIQPGIFFGKGFGDLPDRLSWLRPFAVTGGVVGALPVGSGGAVAVSSAMVGKLASPISSPTAQIFHWGLSLQYSTYYLTNRFSGGPPKDEPLEQFVPLVEFSFNSPVRQNTAATMNPGLAYVAVAWQVAAEAIVPLNREGGSGLGFRAQLLLFLDDLVPAIFGKPLLSVQPNRSQIAWR
jgi:hypothetical protein